jgi:hypothetical protein
MILIWLQLTVIITLANVALIAGALKLRGNHEKLDTTTLQWENRFYGTAVVDAIYYYNNFRRLQY